MITCTKCGHQNAENVEFCAACGSLLEWTGHRPPKEPASSLTLQIWPTEVTVEAGTETECEVRIRNTGTIVDEFLIELQGEAAEWAAVEPASLRLLPGSDAVARITLQPPRLPQTRAGQSVLDLRVPWAAGSERWTEEEVTVSVGRFSALQASIAPQTVEAIGPADYTLMLRSQGNDRAEVQLLASDPDEKLSFEFAPASHVIEPGGQRGLPPPRLQAAGRLSSRSALPIPRAGRACGSTDDNA